MPTVIYKGKLPEQRIADRLRNSGRRSTRRRSCKARRRCAENLPQYSPLGWPRRNRQSPRPRRRGGRRQWLIAGATISTAMSRGG